MCRELRNDNKVIHTKKIYIYSQIVFTSVKKFLAVIDN